VRSLSRFDGRSSFGTWLYRIATNVCLDHLRRRRRRPTLSLDPAVAETIATDDAADVAITDRLAIEAALSELSEEFRVAVVLREVADLDYADIAAILDVPIGTVRSRIARGRAALANRLGNRIDRPERPNPAP
jgi:RNA polymerase sigma-70 factor (ECF subfamily)